MDDPTPADLAGIQQLYSRYCFGFDRKDAELFAGCFVPDGVLAVGDREYAGHDTLRAVAEFAGDRPRHHYLNPLVDEVRGDRARARAYFLTVDVGNGENSGCGEYVDELVRSDDGAWRFVRRRIDFHWQSEAYRARAASIDAATDTDG